MSLPKLDYSPISPLADIAVPSRPPHYTDTSHHDWRRDVLIVFMMDGNAERWLSHARRCTSPFTLSHLHLNMNVPPSCLDTTRLQSLDLSGIRTVHLETTEAAYWSMICFESGHLSPILMVGCRTLCFVSNSQHGALFRDN